MIYKLYCSGYTMFNYIDCQVIYTMFNYIDCQVIYTMFNYIDCQVIYTIFNYIDCQVIYTMFNYIDCQVIFLFSIRSTLEINYFSLKFTLWATYLPVSWLGIVFHEIRFDVLSFEWHIRASFIMVNQTSVKYTSGKRRDNNVLSFWLKT